VPSIAGLVLASVLAGVVETTLRPYLGVRVTAFIALVTWGGVYYFTRKWLLAVRDGA
jgi:hypothetical protein